MRLFLGRITPGETLIIFDEIQECPAALNALKYFSEKPNVRFAMYGNDVE